MKCFNATYGTNRTRFGASACIFRFFIHMHYEFAVLKRCPQPWKGHSNCWDASMTPPLVVVVMMMMMVMMIEGVASVAIIVGAVAVVGVAVARNVWVSSVVWITTEVGVAWNATLVQVTDIAGIRCKYLVFEQRTWGK